MRRLLILMIALVAAVSSAFAFTACDLFGNSSDGTDKVKPDEGDKAPDGDEDETPPEGEDETPHVHDYKLKIDPKPTLTTTGAVVSSCECGDKQTLVLPVLSDGRYIKTKDTATCAKGGSVEYKITLSGAQYMFTVATPATGEHKYTDGVCSCGASDPDYVPHVHSYEDKTDASGHWTECACGAKTAVIPHSWTYEKDKDGHWQVCSAGNEATAKEAHVYKNGVCVCGAAEPVDPDGVKSVIVLHEHGEGKYLWNESDVLAGEYNLFGARLHITHNDGTVSYQPLTAAMLNANKKLTCGNHNLTVTYGGKTASFTVFVAPDDGFIEAVDGKYTVNGSADTILIDASNPADIDFGGLSITGEFNLLHNGITYSGYYGETPVNQRFTGDIGSGAPGLQQCKIKAGNISSDPAVIGNLDVMIYSGVVTEERVFVSGVVIFKVDGSVVFKAELLPERPYLDLNNIPGVSDFREPDYRAELYYKKGTFTVYSGGGTQTVAVSDIFAFNISGYEITGDTDLWSVCHSGERTVTLSGRQETASAVYTVYDSRLGNIRKCHVLGDAVLDYELKDGVTLDTIKQDLLKRELFVEYFSAENGSYFDIVPITGSMIEFGGVDVNSYDTQLGIIRYKNKSIAVNITRPYSVAGATVLYTLKNTAGVNLILSDKTFNDLGQCMKDVCKEIVLYNNGVAMLKHTANGIGNVLIGYKMEGGRLTLIRHGFATSFLTVNISAKTFDELDIEAEAAGMSSVVYTFSHVYFPEATRPIGWSGTFTAYNGQTGFEYANFVNVHLTGYASTVNADGYIYQIAGVEYAASWAYGWHNNKQAFVLRFADKDWWFEIGSADDTGRYRLTLIETSSAS